MMEPQKEIALPSLPPMSDFLSPLLSEARTCLLCDQTIIGQPTTFLQNYLCDNHDPHDAYIRLLSWFLLAINKEELSPLQIGKKPDPTNKKNPPLYCTIIDILPESITLKRALAIFQNRYLPGKYVHNYTENEKTRVLRRVVFYSLIDRGKFVVDQDQQCYYFENRTKQLYKITEQPTDTFKAIITDLGFTSSTVIGKEIIRWIQDHAIKDGEKVQLYKVAHYNKQTKCLYIFDGINQMWKLTGSDIPKKIDNGDDEVLFAQPLKRAFPIDYIPYDEHQEFIGRLRPRSSPHLFQRLASDRINFKEPENEKKELSIEQKQFLYDAYFLIIPFYDQYKVHPAMLLDGDTSSGKSLALKYISHFLYNTTTSIFKEDPRDFAAAAKHKELLCFENVDSSWNEKLEDPICSLITGADDPKRQLFSTDNMIAQTYHNWLIMDARTPKIKRPDLVNRFISLQLQQFRDYNGTLTVKNEELFWIPLEDKTILNQIWSEYLECLNDIVRWFRTCPKVLDRDYGGSRITEFADFCYLIAPLLQKTPDFVLDTLKKMRGEQEDKALLCSSVNEIIYHLRQKMLKGSFPNNYWTARDLFDLCRDVIPQDFKFTSTQNFGRALSEQKKALQETYFFYSKIQHKQNVYYFADKDHLTPEEQRKLDDYTIQQHLEENESE